MIEPRYKRLLAEVVPVLIWAGIYLQYRATGCIKLPGNAPTCNDAVQYGVYAIGVLCIGGPLISAAMRLRANRAKARR